MAHRRWTLTGPALAASVDGRLVAWCDGRWFGDDVVIAHAHARHAITTKTSAVIDDGREEIASGDSMLGVLAAMASYSPGQVTVTHAPEDLRKVLPVSAMTAGFQAHTATRVDDRALVPRKTTTGEGPPR